MYLVKKLFKHKSPREMALSFISLMKSAYSELIVTMDRKFEEGRSFPSELYDKPSEHLKFELLSVLRSQLNMYGPKVIFDESLRLLSEVEALISSAARGSQRVERDRTLNFEPTQFFTEMLASSLAAEINGLYEYTRDILWFAHWMIRENLDDKPDSFGAEDSQRSAFDPDFRAIDANKKRKELKAHEAVCRALLCLSICVRGGLFQKETVTQILGCMRTFKTFEHLRDINESIFVNFLNTCMFSPGHIMPTAVPMVIKQLIRMKEFRLLERSLQSLKNRNAGLNFVLAVCKSFRGDILGFQKCFSNALTSVSIESSARDCLIEDHIFGNSEHDPEFLRLVEHVNNPILVFAKSCLDQLDD